MKLQPRTQQYAGCCAAWRGHAGPHPPVNCFLIVPFILALQMPSAASQVLPAGQMQVEQAPTPTVHCACTNKPVQLWLMCACVPIYFYLYLPPFPQAKLCSDAP